MAPESARNHDSLWHSDDGPELTLLAGRSVVEKMIIPTLQLLLMKMVMMAQW